MLKSFCKRGLYCKSKAFKTFKRFCETYYNPRVPIDFPCKTYLLPNGVRVIKEQNSSNLECITVMVEAGPRYEVDYNHGISHFIEHVAYLGFKTLAKKTFQDSMRSIGAWMGVRTTREYQEYTFICFPESIGIILEYIPKFMRELDPKHEDICEVMNHMYRQLEDRETDIPAQLYDFIHKAAYQGTPMSKSVYCPTWNLKKFSKLDVINFLLEQYQPHKLVVASSGPVEISVFESACNTSLNKIFPTTENVDHGPTRFTGSWITYRNDDVGYGHCALGVEAPGYTSPEFLTFKIMTHIMGRYHPSMGNQEGMWPELVNMAATSQSNLLYLKPFYYYYHDVGIWGMQFASTPLEIDDLAMGVMWKWADLSVNCSDSDLDLAKNALKFELARNADGAIRSSHDMALQVLYKCQRKSLKELYGIVDGINRSMVMSAADAYLWDREIVLAAYGTTEGLTDLSPLRAYTFWLRM